MRLDDSRGASNPCPCMSPSICAASPSAAKSQMCLPLQENLQTHYLHHLVQLQTSSMTFLLCMGPRSFAKGRAEWKARAGTVLSSCHAGGRRVDSVQVQACKGCLPKFTLVLFSPSFRALYQLLPCKHMGSLGIRGYCLAFPLLAACNTTWVSTGLVSFACTARPCNCSFQANHNEEEAKNLDNCGPPKKTYLSFAFGREGSGCSICVCPLPRPGFICHGDRNYLRRGPCARSC